MAGAFDNVGTIIAIPEYVTIIDADGATLLTTYKKLTREELLQAFGCVEGVVSSPIPFIDSIGLPLEDMTKPWYEAAHRFEPYNLHPEYCLDWNWESGGDTDLGTGIVSPMNGIITAASNYHSTWGNIIQVTGFRPGDGRFEILVWMGAHLDKIEVNVGDIVLRGQHIGTMGTGNGQYAAHLHEQWCSGAIPPATAYPSNKSYKWLHPEDVYAEFVDATTLKNALEFNSK